MTTPTRRATKILLIRHAEKPGPDGQPPYGVDAEGRRDGKSLSVRGWQRAGALAVLFAPSAGPLQHPALATPQHLYAGNPSPPGRSNTRLSRRLLETLAPLSARLGLPIDQSFAVGDEQPVADAAMAQTGPVLISWQHKRLPLLANRILGDDTTAPQFWPAERFDLVWVFDLQGGRYRFSQAPELLLDGDSDAPIG